MPGSSSLTAPAKLDKFLRARPGAEITLERLHDIAEIEDPYDLAELLVELIHEGRLERFVRIESPGTHGGIADFSDILEIPSIIHDPSSDTELTVSPDNLRTMFRVKG